MSISVYFLFILFFSVLCLFLKNLLLCPVVSTALDCSHLCPIPTP